MPYTPEQREAARAEAMARGPAPKPEPRSLDSHITPGLTKAMAEFQKDLPKIERDRHVDVITKEDKENYDYDYATLEHISTVVLPRLGALGLAFISTPTIGLDGHAALRYYLTHADGGYITAEYPLRGDKYQQIGSAITYMRRYCLQGVTGVAAPEDDDDGAKADEGPRAATAQRRDTARAAQAEANTARRRSQAAERADDPPREPAPEQAATPASTRKTYSPPRDPSAPVSQPQQTAMVMQFAELQIGRNDRDKRLAIVSGLVGREVTSIKDLNAGEAHEMMEIITSALETPNPLRTLKDVADDIAAQQAGELAVDGEPAPTDPGAEWEQELADAKRQAGEGQNG